MAPPEPKGELRAEIDRQGQISSDRSAGWGLAAFLTRDQPPICAPIDREAAQGQASGRQPSPSGQCRITNLLWIYPTLPPPYPLRGHVRHIHRRLVRGGF